MILFWQRGLISCLCGFGSNGWCEFCAGDDVGIFAGTSAQPVMHAAVELKAADVQLVKRCQLDS